MDLHAMTDRARRPSEARLHCCAASGCLASGGGEVRKSLDRAVAERGLKGRVEVVGVGCLGLCGRGPLVELAPSGALFERVTAENAPSLVGAAVGDTPRADQLDPRHPFFSSQLKIV